MVTQNVFCAVGTERRVQMGTKNIMFSRLEQLPDHRYSCPNKGVWFVILKIMMLQYCIK